MMLRVVDWEGPRSLTHTSGRLKDSHPHTDTHASAASASSQACVCMPTLFADGADELTNRRHACTSYIIDDEELCPHRAELLGA